jgi:hypothetical protein
VTSCANGAKACQRPRRLTFGPFALRVKWLSAGIARGQAVDRLGGGRRASRPRAHHARRVLQRRLGSKDQAIGSPDTVGGSPSGEGGRSGPTSAVR